jgi:predicted TIM-barrel fold metal-dependent hydrolase
MTYVGDRVVYDADSHVMEPADFLDPFLSDEDAPLLRREGLERMRPLLDEAMARHADRRSDPAIAAKAEERLWTDKGWMAMGAFDTAERARALDLMGVSGQLVFATFASAMYLGRNPDRLYAGAAAQNRAMNEFCSADPRLMAVAFVPLRDPARAVSLATEAIEGGCKAVMVPHTAAGDRSPTHPDLDGFWDLLAQADIPFVLHVGGGSGLIDQAFHNNAMPVTDHLGGGENVRSKDYLAIPHEPQTFLGVLVLDGLFDRFPTLRGGAIELGAGWVVSWLHHLDLAVRSFGRTEEPLRRLTRTPSEYVREHVTFTPFPGEDVGWMIDAAGPELFMYSSDYPHPEGTRDPLGRFEATLDGVDDAAREAFFSGNFARTLGSHTPAAV